MSICASYTLRWMATPRCIISLSGALSLNPLTSPLPHSFQLPIAPQLGWCSTPPSISLLALCLAQACSGLVPVAIVTMVPTCSTHVGEQTQLTCSHLLLWLFRSFHSSATMIPKLWEELVWCRCSPWDRNLRRSPAYTSLPLLQLTYLSSK